MARPLALLLTSLSAIAAAWWWLGTPVVLAYPPVDPARKLDCVSYAPFRDQQTPFDQNLVISAGQIAQDLAELAKVSKCVRTYSVDNGLDKVPGLAAKVGLKVILGIWIGRDATKNAQLIDKALSLVKQNHNVISAIMVGSEVLLRGEMTVSDLRATIRSVKARTDVPVSYADVWEFWLRDRDVASDVDFITVHMLPYWEDAPPRAEDAAAHVDDVRKRLIAAFPGKQILIGEAGWPSRGRMRDGALPSRVNQARFISELLDRAKQEDFRVTLFEAYDEPWKRQWEGTVGSSWGLFDGWHRGLKYPPGRAIRNHPFWKWQMACGLAVSILVFATALLAARRRKSSPRLSSWIAVATSATAGGVLFGLAAEKMLDESYGLGGWLVQGFLLAAAIAALLLSSDALILRRALPAFVELIGPGETRIRSFVPIGLGFTLAVTTLLAADTALGLVFDARWRDFPFAALTMAAVPLWILTLLNRPASGVRPVAEAVFAGLLGAAALYMIFNEGFDNWQSLWTAGAYLLLGSTLWRARSTAFAPTTESAYGALSEMSSFEGRDGVAADRGRAPEPV